MMRMSIRRSVETIVCYRRQVRNASLKYWSQRHGVVVSFQCSPESAEIVLRHFDARASILFDGSTQSTANVDCGNRG